MTWTPDLSLTYDVITLDLSYSRMDIKGEE